MSRPYTLAVPNLEAYTSKTGIGRVLLNLQKAWGDRVQCQGARFSRLSLPVLRNAPYGVTAPSGSDLVFLPQLTGASALSTLRKLPSLVVVHDIGVVDCPEDKQDMDWLTLQLVMSHLRSLRFASHIVAVSHFTRERLLAHLPSLEGKVSVIPNAIDDTFLNFRLGRVEALRALEQQRGLRLERPLLLYVGSEIPRKNVQLLLEVLKVVQLTWPRAQLLKVGGAGGETYRQQTLSAMKHLDLKAGRDVVFLQDLDDRLLACAYKCADIFVSTSLYEGFGLPAAEALALGLPVVTTNAGSFPEIVADAGSVVEPDVKAFSEAVLSVLSGATPVKKQRGTSWQESAEAYLNLIEQLAPGRQ